MEYPYYCRGREPPPLGYSCPNSELVLTLREQLDIQVLANASFTVLNAALAGDNYRALGVETDLFKEVAN